MAGKDGSIATSYKYIADLGVAHFKGIYKEDDRINIVELV
jgi:hypothetical protein